MEVVLKDGTTFKAKFMEKTGKFVVFDGGRRVRKGDISVFTIAGSRSGGKR